MKFTTGNITTVIAALLVLGGLYWHFFTGTPSPSLTSTVAPPASEEQFLTLAGELSSVSFDTSIFSDPRFAVLQDLTTPITPEQIGRPDPFAPLGE